MPMLKIMMRTDLLLKEIDEVFPVMLMPASAELTDHQEDCESCDDVRHYLNAYRDIEVDKTLIRFLRQNLYQLSPMTFRWFLPHYLKYCLSSDWADAQEETYFLVYNLGSDPQFESDAYLRLSVLNAAQINCLISFLKWCTGVEDCVDIEEEIDKAVDFLKKLFSKFA